MKIFLLFLSIVIRFSLGQVKDPSQILLNRPNLPIPIEEARKRFIPYKYLSSDDQQRVRTLGFTQTTWDNPYVSDQAPSIEFEDYGSIQAERPDLALLIDRLGISPRAWDCYVTHYFNYNWDDLARFIDRGTTIQANLRVLGWNRETWDLGQTPVRLTTLFWRSSSGAGLTDAERRAAAIGLCYFEETWDEYTLPQYRVALVGRALGRPDLRYTEWNDLPASTKSTATGLGYTNETWNFASGPGPTFENADIEYFSYYDLREQNVNDPRIQQIDRLGFDVFSWDNCMHRWYAYEWTELVTWGIAPFLQQIGWNPTSWENDVYPTTYSRNWVNLTKTQRDALSALCYDQPRWDRLLLDSNAPTVPPTLFPTYSPSASPSASPSSTPSASPSSPPTGTPSASPSSRPSATPSVSPSSLPSSSPSVAPSSLPSASPSRNPTGSPSSSQSSSPSSSPSMAPSSTPSTSPSTRPTGPPTLSPSALPSTSPSRNPTGQPTISPSAAPTSTPSASPSSLPSASPSARPTGPPTLSPSAAPTISSPPSQTPSVSPSSKPSSTPSASPTQTPSSSPSLAPTQSVAPSFRPSSSPSDSPTDRPSVSPTDRPSTSPSFSPTLSMAPSESPSFGPSVEPSSTPTVPDSSRRRIAKRVTQSMTTDGIPQISPNAVPDTVVLAMESQFESFRRRLQSIDDPGITDFANSATLVQQSYRNGTLTTVYDHRVSYVLARSTDIISDEAIFMEPFEDEAFLNGYLIRLRQADPTFVSTDSSSFRMTVANVPNSGGGNSSGGSSAGIIAGAAVGGVALFAVAGYLIYNRQQGTKSDEDIYAREVGSQPSADYADFQHEIAKQSFNPNVSVAMKPLNMSGISGPDFSELDELATRSVNTSGDYPELSPFAAAGIDIREEVIEIQAPSGQLGIVLDTPSYGPPLIHAIKATSPIAEFVQIGDKLIAVDDDDVTELDALQVSRLIGSRSRKRVRRLTILRETFVEDF